jgi:hypothetical protein
MNEQCVRTRAPHRPLDAHVCGTAGARAQMIEASGLLSRLRHADAQLWLPDLPEEASKGARSMVSMAARDLARATRRHAAATAKADNGDVRAIQMSATLLEEPAHDVPRTVGRMDKIKFAGRPCA